jgi:uncharacterized protein YegL
MARAVRAAFLLLCLIAGSRSARAQSSELTILDVDRSRFPEMRARFYAVNPDRSPAQPSASEIALTDNGQIVPDPTITCSPPAPAVPLSSVLVIDISGSMSGERLDIARAGARAWIDALAPGRSECAITSFDDRNYLNQDFTTDHSLLGAAVDNLVAGNGTDYDQGLLLPAAGALQVSARGRYRRVIVFLTDGLSKSEPQTAAIIAEARRQGCAIYPVTLGLPCPVSLRQIAEQSGGEAFEQVTTVAEIERIYRLLALRSQNASACEATWNSIDRCSDGTRTVAMKWKGSQSSISYQLDRRAVVSIDILPSMVHIRPRAIGLPIDTTVIVTATKRTEVGTITSSNPAFSISPKQLYLDAGESATLTIRYTPRDSSYQWTRFDLMSNGCIVTLDAGASYPRSRVKERTLVVNDPNGGEEFVAGSDTVIRWSGIPPGDRVRIEYSTDNGATWIGITDDATGGEYKWRVPRTPSPVCRVRVSQVSSIEEGEWVRSIGSSRSDIAYSVVVDARGNSYVCGSFFDTIQVGARTLTSAGFNDIYVAKYGPDGTPIWAVRAGSPGSSSSNLGFDAAYSIALDDEGNIVIGGMASPNADIGPLHIPGTQPDVSSLFVAKLSSDGAFLWARAFEVGNRAPVAIDVDDNGDIAVTGSFDGTRDFGGIALTPVGAFDGFLAKLNRYGTVLWARSIGGANNGVDEHGRQVAFDRDGSVVTLGSFGASTDFGGATLLSAGQEDIYLARYTTEGNLVWARRAGGTFTDIPGGLAIDSTGNIYIGGSIAGPAAFDRITLPADTGLQMFVAKYRSDGAVAWAFQSAGDFPRSDPRAIFMTHSVEALAVDDAGELYLCGSTSGNTLLQGTWLRPRGWQEIVVAQVHPDGSLAWARRAGASWQDYGSGIAVAPDGALHIAGAIDGRYDSPDVGADTIETAGDRDAVLWRLGYSILQSDSSDAPFAIVVPDAAALDVDMGRVVVGDAHDSVVAAFVRNTGRYPLVVQRIAIEGADRDQFGIVSGAGPYSLDPGASHPVEFHFAPTRVGAIGAEIVLVAGGDTLRHSIRGEGIERAIEVVSDLIDFGRVTVGGTRDTIRAVTITNRGAVAVTITAIRHEGPNAVDFTTIAGGGTTVLPPGDTVRLDLRFAPNAVGRTSGRLVFEFDGAGSPAFVLLYGEGVTANPASASLIASSVAARAGEELDIPILLRDAVNLEHAGATSIAATLRFNASLLYPIGATPVGSIIDGERVIRFELPMPAGGNILGSLRFVALLGNDSTTALELEDAVAIGGDVALASAPAEFRLLDLCHAGGARLFNPYGQTAIVKARSDPAGLAAEVEIETVERGRIRLVLVDILGREVMVVADGERDEGRHLFTVDTRGLSAGSYYLVLSTPTVRRVARVDLVQ